MTVMSIYGRDSERGAWSEEGATHAFGMLPPRSTLHALSPVRPSRRIRP